MAFKMKGFSTHAGTSMAKKALIGNQNNLPEGLKAKIEAAPGKMYNSPNKQAKPDFIDIDGDGNTTESMKSASPNKQTNVGGTESRKGNVFTKKGRTQRTINRAKKAENKLKDNVNKEGYDTKKSQKLMKKAKLKGVKANKKIQKHFQDGNYASSKDVEKAGTIAKQYKGKNYESSKGDQQGPIPKDNIKLQKSEHPDTYVYKGKSEFERINDLEERKSFIKEDEFNLGESTKQQTKDKANLEREAEIMRDRSKNKSGKKSYYKN